MSFIALFFVAVCAGLVGVVSGIGNGVILIPILTLSGIDIKQAIAIGSLSTLASSIASASSYVRRHMPNLNASAFLEVFAVGGALIGALITVVSETRPLFFLCGSVLLLSWLLLWSQGKQHLTATTQQDALSRWLELEGSYYDYADGRTIIYYGRNAVPAALFMVGAGLLSTLLGFGGSALAVLVPEGVMGFPTKVSLTTSQLIVGVMVLTGVGIYLEAGLISATLVCPVILGVTLGSVIGSKLLLILRSRVVRGIFLSVMIVLGIEMILRGVRGF